MLIHNTYTLRIQKSVSFQVQGHFKVIQGQMLKQSIKFLFIGLLLLIFRQILRYLVGMLSQLWPILNCYLGDFGQGQGHIAQGQMTKIEGNI